MKHLFIFGGVCILLSCVSEEKSLFSINYSNNRYDTSFIYKWDSITKQSLLLSYASENSERGKHAYKNLLDAFEDYGYYSDSLKKGFSIRALFVEQVFKKNMFGFREFLIIEETRSGESIKTYTYFLPIKNSLIDSIYCFALSDKGKWCLWRNLSSERTLSFKYTTLYTSKVAYGKGENLNKLIFSVIKDEKVIASEVFPRGTLSDKSELSILVSFLNRIE